MTSTSSSLESTATPSNETYPVADVPEAEALAVEESSNGSPPEVEAEAEPAGAPAFVSTDDYPPLQEESAGAVAAPTKLVVIRGQKLNAEYVLYPGENYLGRTDEKPVDIDLEEQEAADRVWSSRQHARVVIDENGITIEDLGSQNGTFVNRTRIYPGQLRPLSAGDVIQIGTVQLKVKGE